MILPTSVILRTTVRVRKVTFHRVAFQFDAQPGKGIAEQINGFLQLFHHPDHRESIPNRIEGICHLLLVREEGLIVQIHHIDILEQISRNVIAQLRQTQPILIVGGIPTIDIFVHLLDSVTIETATSLKAEHAPDAFDGMPHHGDRIRIVPTKVIRDGEGTAVGHGDSITNAIAAVVVLIVDTGFVPCLGAFGELGGGDFGAGFGAALAGDAAVDPLGERCSTGFHVVQVEELFGWGICC
mmetsp:Transcript_3744/g.5645  ORF Transcript_3744/g.5645 Transcript_3744/m.5645 type:complete len:240 (+) Transcript_3744:236-955(+)